METINGYNIITLTPALAKKYGEELVDMLNDIPGANFVPEDILREGKEGRIFYNKWKHSFLLMDNDTVVAVIMGHERKAIPNTNYTEDSLYINELAVHRSYRGQGIGSALVQWYIKTQIMKHLPETHIFSIQTNSKESNAPVQRLYESLGFKKGGEKQYADKVDNVYFLRK